MTKAQPDDSKSVSEPDDSKSVSEQLGELVERTGAITAMVISRDGTGIAEAGDTNALDTAGLAALIAGMFTATREVARMVGEQRFSILLQQGESRHIHISLLTDHAMMVVIFADNHRIGKVRHEAQKTGRGLIPILTRGRDSQRARSEVSPSAFKEYALELIDRIFVNE